MALPLSKGLVDISVLGDKELSRQLAKMHPRLQRLVARRALKKSAKRIKPLLVQAVSGVPVGVRTGKLLGAMTQVKIEPLKRSRTRMGFAIPLPTREALGLSATEKGFPPFALEYGTRTIRPRFWIRGTVNRAMPAEQRQIGVDIGKGIQREWKKGKHWITTGKKT